MLTPHRKPVRMRQVHVVGIIGERTMSLKCFVLAGIIYWMDGRQALMQQAV